ncbi:MAG: hypothetical protein JXA46_08335 [Dehalococcoidales bacterium]|nr:hypothetical protein [Dehalococcoidales bacterium]
MTKSSDSLNLLLKWARFLLWLPWFVIAFPWHIRRAYSQAMYWIDCRQASGKNLERKNRDRK